jgi:hypothetical protein
MTRPASSGAFLPTLQEKLERRLREIEASRAATRTEASHPRCSDPPSPQLVHGLEQFNREEFWECHETLEGLWRAERDPIRYLYQGVLHIGVAFHHLKRGNYRGARRLLASGLVLLEPFSPRCCGIEVATLVEEARRWLALVEAYGPQRVRELAAMPPPRVSYTIPDRHAPGH